MLQRFANVRDADVTGARAPYVQPGGNQQFTALMENGFQYDSSLASLQMDPPLWPYTLDYLSESDCVVKPCPTASFPGIWEIPLVAWLDTNDTFCSVIDSCYMPNDKEEALTLLRSNFHRHYDSNKAPFVISLRSRCVFNFSVKLANRFATHLPAPLSSVFIEILLSQRCTKRYTFCGEYLLFYFLSKAAVKLLAWNFV